MIFVSGATGRVGRHVVAQLVEMGVPVRALARDLDRAELPAEVDLVKGDLSDPSELERYVDGADAAFLLWPFVSDAGAGELVSAIARHTPRIVYLSAAAAADRPDSFWASLERRIEQSGGQWTFLRPTGFAANTLMWAAQIRDGSVVRWPYGEAARSLIHERDIAAVAIRALTQGGHNGARYILSGPQALTQIEQVRAIGHAIGRPLRWEELSRDVAREQLTATFGDAAFAESALTTWAAFVTEPELVTSTVQAVTGTPARTYQQWASDYAESFR